MDLSKADENGATMEFSVLKHAQEIGTNSFKTAFLDLYHDKIMLHKEEALKEQFAKDNQAKFKQGVVGQTTAPRTGVQNAGNVRGKSYNDLLAEALDELG